MPSLVERKKLELQAKSRALAGELQHWRDESAANKPYEKHHSQIARIAARLDAVLATLLAEIDGLRDAADAVLPAGQRIEEKLLATHLVWDFFRSRLAMRADAFLRTYLEACDEFAWSCYEGARHRVGSGVIIGKEPPLVFLNGGWSPFAVSRERALDLDRPAFSVANSTVAWLETGEFHGIVRDLPFPMIGVPWYQLRHLPDALVLGHEMGHVLEWDFALKPDMEAALAAAPLIPSERRAAWSAWRTEVFADMVGVLAGGPRFGGALMDFLATSPAKIQQERRTPGVWGAYPMRWLRIELVACALRHTGFEKECDALRADWQQTYGAAKAQQEFLGDVPAIVTALMEGPYTALAARDGDGGAAASVGAAAAAAPIAAAAPKLTDLLSFRKDAAGAPFDEAVVDAMFGQGSLDFANPRECFAAARLLYERDPAAFANADHNTRICELVIAHRMPGTRGTPADSLDTLEIAEQALAGDWLFGPRAETRAKAYSSGMSSTRSRTAGSPKRM